MKTIMVQITKNNKIDMSIWNFFIERRYELETVPILDKNKAKRL